MAEPEAWEVGQGEAAEKGPRAEAVRLSLWKRLILLCRGRVFLRYERREGWSGRLGIYAFLCPRHGIQTDYQHGFDQRLDCPLCGYSSYGLPPGTDLEP